MKSNLRRSAILLAIVVMLFVSIPTQAMTRQNDCLSAYNQELIACDANLSGFTRAGCKMDAFRYYYVCLLDAATG